MFCAGLERYLKNCSEERTVQPFVNPVYRTLKLEIFIDIICVLAESKSAIADYPLPQQRPR